MENKKPNIRLFMFRLYATVLVLLSLFLITIFIGNEAYIKRELSIEKFSLSEQKAYKQKQTAYNQRRADYVRKHSSLTEKIDNLNSQIKILREAKLSSDIYRQVGIDTQIYNIKDIIRDAQAEIDNLQSQYQDVLWQGKLLSKDLSEPSGKTIERKVFDYKATAIFVLVLLVIWAIPYTIHFIIEWLISGLRG